MKILHSAESNTTKYIHEDGSETSIKLSLSGQYDHQLNLLEKDNDKYSVVISCSSGCVMSCKFCHLTEKGCKSYKLTNEDVFSNARCAILETYKHHPEIKDKYIKLCWMGMGDPLFDTDMVRWVTNALLEWVEVLELAKGLDGVDVSTVFPNVSRWGNPLAELNRELKHKKRNPVSVHKSPLRMFYSLHSAEQQVRDELIPNAMDLNRALYKLHTFSINNEVDLILHYMFLSGVNDRDSSMQELESVVQWYGLSNIEFRVLRYNPSENSVYTESKNLKEIVWALERSLPNVKVQHSSGEDVQSACGMFVVGG